MGKKILLAALVLAFSAAVVWAAKPAKPLNPAMGIDDRYTDLAPDFGRKSPIQPGPIPTATGDSIWGFTPTGGDVYGLGVDTDGSNIYVSVGNVLRIYRYDMDGNQIGWCTQPRSAGYWGFRDIAYNPDQMYYYGSCDGSPYYPRQITRFIGSSCTHFQYFRNPSGTPSLARALAYGAPLPPSPAADSVWLSNWYDPIYLTVDPGGTGLTGPNVRNCPSIGTAKYSVAYMPAENGWGPWLFESDQYTPYRIFMRDPEAAGCPIVDQWYCPGIAGGLAYWHSFWRAGPYFGEPCVLYLVQSSPDRVIVYHVKVPVPYDVGVRSIDVPPSCICPQTPYTPKATVANEGTNTATFDVTMTIDSYSSTKTVTGLAPGLTAQVDFDPWTSGDPLTVYDIVVAVDYPPDMNPANDTMAVSRSVAAYCEDFETWDGMYEPDPESGGWEWGVPTSGPGSAHSGVNLWATNLEGNYDNSAQWRLETLEFRAPMDNPLFTYWHWYNTESFWDGYNVKMSTDCGTSWNVITPVGGYPEDGIYGMGYEPGFSASSGGWEMVTFILPVMESDQLHLMFHFGSDASVNSYPGVYIDDVCANLEPKYPPPDLDIDDNDGDLAANTMTLAGPTGSVVVGEFNLINPEEDLGGMNCPNVDYYDGPSTIDETVAFTFPTTLTSVGGGHQFNPSFYAYSDVETGEMSFTTLDLCQSRRVLLQVGIPHPATPNKVYQGVVSATGTALLPAGVPMVLTDDDDFGLYVHVVPTGGGNIWGPGFKGTPSPDGNLLEWTGLAFGQQGYNVYRFENGSPVKLNESFLTDNIFVDRDVREGQTHEYNLGLPLSNGEEILIGPISVTRGMTPRVCALYQNFPNPTRDETTIRYAVASPTKVSLRVFNVAGQVVKTLVNEEQKPGYYHVSWKPEDDANGVYFYRLTAGDFSQTRKLVVLR